VADERIIGVVVTHRRRELLADSLKVLASQSRPLDHLVVVDNGDEDAVRELVDAVDLPTSYLGSKHNLGGAGGFALGILYALSLGADRVWLADDDGRPEGPDVLVTLLDCAQRNGLAEVSPVVCDIAQPDRLAFPLRRGVVWRRWRHELGDEDLLPGIASLFNGALFTAAAIDAVGVPDLRLFVRGAPASRRPICTRTAPTSSSRFSAAGCTRSIRTTTPSASSPTATAATCCRSRDCAGCCPRNGCGSAGTS
jgi:rhamnopyranosyl-N-acetylglucosaminyl-diphospho-decaprenol beta-1,3/1,4-galactofuranosyltransferase